MGEAPSRKVGLMSLPQVGRTLRNPQGSRIRFYITLRGEQYCLDLRVSGEIVTLGNHPTLKEALNARRVFRQRLFDSGFWECVD